MEKPRESLEFFELELLGPSPSSSRVDLGRSGSSDWPFRRFQVYPALPVNEDPLDLLDLPVPLDLLALLALLDLLDVVEDPSDPPDPLALLVLLDQLDQRVLME